MRIVIGPIRCSCRLELLTVSRETEPGRDQLRPHVRRAKRIRGGINGRKVWRQIVIDHSLVITGKHVEVVRLAWVQQRENRSNPHPTVGKRVDVWRVHPVANDLSRRAVFLHHNDDVVVARRRGPGINNPEGCSHKYQGEQRAIHDNSDGSVTE